MRLTVGFGLHLRCNRILLSDQQAPDLQQLVALVHYVFHPSTWTPEDYCYLQDLFVSPAYRAQGLGRQLIEAVYSVAETQKCSRVYWLTHESNTSARSLYDQIADHVGFIQYRKNLIP